MNAGMATIAISTLVLVAGCVSTDPPRAQPQSSYEYQTFDERGNPTDAAALGQSIWGLGEGTALTEAAPFGAELDQQQDPEQDAEEERRRREAIIRSTFGSGVIIGQDGRVTKRYSLGTEAGPVFLGLLTPFSTGATPAEVKAGTGIGGQDLDSILGRMLGPEHPVELVYLPEFEVIYNMPLAIEKQPLGPPQRADNYMALLLVTAQPSSLLAFEQALNLFFAHMPQVEIEVQVVEYSTNESLSFGVTQIDKTTPILRTLGSSQLVQQISSSFPLSAPLIGGSGLTDIGVLTLGGIHDNFELNATLEMLETLGIADIKSNPKLVVRNGGLATIKIKTEIPYPKSTIVSNTNDLISTDILFKEVGITLHIRPEIAGTDTVILQIDASVSAVVGFANTVPVLTPIVATREAATSVHLRVGQTTVIGGLVSETTFETESKIPILGDIPILGYLFRSTSTQTTRTVLEFFVTPRILRGPQGFSAEGLGVR